MGGNSTACTDGTRNVFIELALFDPLRTARTGRKLNLQSDARFRFERGVDPQAVMDGMETASRLVCEMCGGEASKAVVAGAPPEAACAIRYRLSRLASLVGMDLASDRQVRILSDLGFEVQEQGDALLVSPPGWRPDVHTEEDVVEEVARIHSLSALPAKPLRKSNPGVAPPSLDALQRRSAVARRLLASRGMNECVCYSFVSAEEAKAFGGDPESLSLQNPIAPSLAVMRPSLLPALLRAVANNRARGTKGLALFEVGATFTGPDPGQQCRSAGGIRCGDAVERSWNVLQRVVDVFDAKADALALASALGVSATKLMTLPKAPSWYHPGRSGSLGLGPRNIVAHFGELHPQLVAGWKIDTPAVAFEFHLENLPPPKSRRGRVSLDASNLQTVERDFAFSVAREVPATEILRAARSGDRKLIQSVRVFDVFDGAEAERQLGEGHKSVAITVRLQPRERTLEDAEIERISGQIVRAVEKATGGAFRD